MESTHDMGSIVIISSKCHKQTSFDRVLGERRNWTFHVLLWAFACEYKAPTSLGKGLLAF